MNTKVLQVKKPYDYTTIFSNSLLFNFVLYGDYKLENKKFVENDFDHFYNKINFKLPLKFRNYLKKRNTIGEGRTTVPPDFYFKVFFMPKVTFSILDSIFNKASNYISKDSSLHLIQFHLSDINLCFFFKENYLGVSCIAIIAKNVSNNNFRGEMNGISNLNILNSLNDKNVINSSIKVLNYSFVPNYLGALKYLKSTGNKSETYRFNSLLSIIPPDSLKKLSDSNAHAIRGFTVVNAENYIKRISSNYDAIAINENHFNLENRIFLTQLLPLLKQTGYTYLFVEGINADIKTESDIDGFSGYYTLNPEFGNLLRRALKLGFIVKAFESEVDCPLNDRLKCDNFRDSIQARNIFDVIKKEHPNKMIIYSGFDHINKSSDNVWKKTVQHLLEQTSLRIFSVDQSRMGNSKVGNNDYFNFVNNNYSIIEPSLLMKGDSIFRTNPTQVDAQVFFPRSKKWYNYIYQYNLLISSKYINAGLYLFENLQYQQIPSHYQKIKSKNLSMFLPKKKYNFLIMSANGYILKSGIISFSKTEIPIN